MSVLGTSDVAELLRLLWPSSSGDSDDSQRWYQQGFEFQTLQGFRLGLVQAHGGPCGVLAAVQAEILRLFLFIHRSEALSETELRLLLEGDKSVADEAARLELLAEAMASLLLQCAEGRVVRVVVQDPAATGDNAAVYKEHTVTVSTTETEELVALLLREMPAFCSSHGVINFTFSVLRTKGVAAVREEMDDPSNALTGAFGHCTQELLNLLLTGSAVSNVFDGSVPMGDTGLYLQGISGRARVGYLTQLEALRYCRVGSYYKSPQFPVWVIGSSSHFSVGFALDVRVCEESASAQLFQRVQRVFKAFDSMETGFIQMGSLADSLQQLGVAPEILSNEYLMARLLGRLEISSGAGIVLWDEYWKVISDEDAVDDAAVEIHHVANLVLGTDDIVDGAGADQWESLSGDNEQARELRRHVAADTKTSIEPNASFAETVIAEVASFHDVFGFLGIPMIIVFVLSALWTFALAYIQVHATSMANNIMNTTEFDNGEFWLLPHPNDGIVISSVVMLGLFGIGYSGLVVIMVVFFRGHQTVVTTANSNAVDVAGSSVPKKGRFYRFISWVRHNCNIPSDIRDQYYTAALDLPKLIFQTTTLFTYLQHGFPTPVVYSYSILLLGNWLVACYRSQRYVIDPNLIIARLYYTYDLFFAVFAPLVVLIYFIYSFEFDRGAFMTRLESIHGGSFDVVARLFGDPSQISSFCNAFHYLQFSSGDTLFFKSALNLLSLYKWRKIIMTLIHNYHERRLERERRALVQPVAEDKSRTRTQTFKEAITKKIEETARRPKLGKHFLPKILLSLIYFSAGSAVFIYSIGAVRSSTELCSKYDKCVMISYHWNFGEEHCTCLVFADRQIAPRTYAEWTDPEDTTSKLAELAVAGELRIVQIINRALPHLPAELQNCHHLMQLILIYTKTEALPAWMAGLSELEYLHLEGDYTSRRLKTISPGIFDHMPHLTFIHFGGIPDVEEFPSISSLTNLRYFTLAIVNSLRELPTFDGLSNLRSLLIVEAERARTLPTLTSLVKLSGMMLLYRSAVCCNGFISGVCDDTAFQCRPKVGEKYPMTCTDARISADNKAILDSFSSKEICDNSYELDLASAAPTKYTSDDLCGSVMYKECSLGGVQGICFNMRMTVISCTPLPEYIKMRRLQIERRVGDPCNPEVEAWLGCR
ncbi:hypothetical protein PHYBOEH_006580 [Phytophthora boehmeriae]|uniref:Deubiquitinating enzyme MINDY-3/4 conserved domain-containing protein n=1 Tax=Phytophthora boehmeriae TaxID=109152 RepID=A0A8T1X1X6_9STRA|nr:hypothetical protein PHYBOEH_006580 [Phytophthora boehmeriae]